MSRLLASPPAATIDTRISSLRPLLPPACLLEEIPTPASVSQFVTEARQIVTNIVRGNKDGEVKDDRLLVVIGPCSIHDVKAAIEYAQKLRVIKEELKEDLFITMRVYFEKPRTRVGWKGLINDPYLDGTFAINAGLRLARRLMLDLNVMGLPVAAEMLDTITPQFIADLIAWGAIGARTTESQVHRELSSGLSFPIGFKNGTTGNIKIAVDAIVAAASPHSFLGVTHQGLAAIVETKGNDDCHLILRGSDQGPNYSSQHIESAIQGLTAAKIAVSIMVDCSHGNSSKNYKNQPIVVKSIAEQLAGDDVPHAAAITGVMIESNLVCGNQSFEPGKHRVEDLVYGQSITDACIDFKDTELVLRELAAAVRTRRQKAKNVQAK